MTRRALIPAAIGITGLVALTLAYLITVEPAPSIRVRWREFIPAQQRAALERRYLLVNARAPQGLSFAYDLLDTRPDNIEALVLDPQVADTNDIDRETYVMRFDAAYGERWMWAAHRTPGLRDARVRWGLIAVLAAMAIGGLLGLLRERRENRSMA